MLSQAVLPNNTVIGYTYDAQGRLIAKRVNGVVTKRWLYDGQLRPVAELAADGDVERYYLYALHANVPEAVIESDGTVYRIITDHLGSPRMVVNTVTGEIVKELAFDEFGNITSETGTYSIPFGFAGGIRDTDTGLTRFGARWYDSETGRWISKEPLGFEGSNNFYAYTDNDPVNFVDMTGLFRYASNVPKRFRTYLESIPFSEHDIAFYSVLFDVPRDQVVKTFKSDNGPYISMGNLINAKGETPNGQYVDDNILINQESWDRAVAAGHAELFIRIVVGHELAHHFDLLDKIHIINSTYPDAGHIWEIMARGEILLFKKDGSIEHDTSKNTNVYDYLIKQGIL